MRSVRPRAAFGPGTGDATARNDASGRTSLDGIA